MSDPTPHEIEAACAEIRSRWTPAERRSRLAGIACWFKHDAEGVEASAREALAVKLAKQRETMPKAICEKIVGSTDARAG